MSRATLLGIHLQNLTCLLWTGHFLGGRSLGMEGGRFPSKGVEQGDLGGQGVRGLGASQACV